MDLENIAKATIPVVLGVIIAGYLMSMLAPSVSIIATAQSGFNGSNG